MRTPSSLLADRWHPSAEIVRRAALAALVMSIVIVVTGGAVRLTGSGLGCTTWPKCTGESLVPTPKMGIYGVIEFTNRMLTYVLCAAVGWAILAARSQKPWQHHLRPASEPSSPQADSTDAARDGHTKCIASTSWVMHAAGVCHGVGGDPWDLRHRSKAESC